MKSRNCHLVISGIFQGVLLMHSCVIYECLLLIGAPFNSDISISFVFTHSNGFLLKSGTVESMICGDFPLQKRKKNIQGSSFFYVLCYASKYSVTRNPCLQRNGLINNTSEISGKFKKPLFIYEKNKKPATYLVLILYIFYEQLTEKLAINSHISG